MKGKNWRIASVALGLAALVAPLAACAPGDGSNTGDEDITLTWLVWNSPNDIGMAEPLIEAFEASVDGITVRLETFPVGTEGDNLVKTKLATGEMEDFFSYNSGAFLHALNPDQMLQPLGDEPWAQNLTDPMRNALSTELAMYGTPLGAGFAGAIMYNKPLYADLGLEVPQSWAEFAANNEAIKAAGKTAVIQTYADPWSAQLLLLGDFANVDAQDPEWADAFTANERKFVDQPALRGFQNLQEGFEAGWWNDDFASATFDDGIRMLSTGEGAHYPMLTATLNTIIQLYPEQVEDVGVFALPAQNAADTRLTLWLPNALYVPKSTEGARLDAVKQFFAFINSPEGCTIQAKVEPPSGPFGTTSCDVPDSVPGMVSDMQVYVDANKIGPAQEFVTPVKGPNLPEITVEVGSGIRTAVEGAALYDNDVINQARQLGLEGW